MGCHFLFQGIFPTQGSNQCLLRWQADSLPLSHQGSPRLFLSLKKKEKDITYFWLRWAFAAVCWLSSVGVMELLTVVAHPVAEHGFQGMWAQPWHTRALLPHGMWSHPRAGFEPVSSALAGRCLTTGPPEKSLFLLFWLL